MFTNLLLADEINRTPPKTQAALLEAMEERQVSVEGTTRPLPEPFVVVATQNPVEYEGTYPLPEAQLDRFLFKLQVAYPDADQEQEILARHHAGLDPHDLGARPACAPWPAPPTSPPARAAGAARRRRAGRCSPTSSRWSGRRGRAPSLAPRRVAPRRGHAAARGQGVGVARRARPTSRPTR